MALSGATKRATQQALGVKRLGDELTDAVDANTLELGGAFVGTSVSVTGDVGSATVTSTGQITAGAGLVANSATAAAIATTRTLTAADSGGCFSVAKTGVYTITLPTPAQGIRFKFLVLDTGANIVTILADGAFCYGMLTEAGATPTAMTGTTILLTSGQSVGDWIELEGIDATHWLVTGSTLAADDITIS